jgi:hypothetical protein
MRLLWVERCFRGIRALYRDQRVAGLMSSRYILLLRTSDTSHTLDDLVSAASWVAVLAFVTTNPARSADQTTAPGASDLLLGGSLGHLGRI